MARLSRPLVTLRAFVAEWAAVFAPPACFVCGQPSPCAAHRLVEPAGARCGRCAARLADPIPAGALCPACRLRRPAFQGVMCLADYRGCPGVRDWILALKHGGRIDLAEPLGQALAGVLKQQLREPAVLVPVPSHPWRHLERGHDPSQQLVDAVARHGGGAPLRALRRLRHTPPQGSPGARGRRLNVDGAFVLRRGLPRGKDQGPAVLVDDVLTSGATADACARQLKRAGWSPIWILVVARAG